MKTFQIFIILALLIMVSHVATAETTYTEQELEDFIEAEVAISANYGVERVGWNHFLHVPNVTQHEDKFVVRPNSDTLYSMIFFDVEDGYLIVQLPETDRYMSSMIYEVDHYLADDGVINNQSDHQNQTHQRYNINVHFKKW